MNATVRGLIWIPSVLITNGIIWYGLHDSSSGLRLIVSLIASLVLRELIGTLFYLARTRAAEGEPD